MSSETNLIAQLVQSSRRSNLFLSHLAGGACHTEAAGNSGSGNGSVPNDGLYGHTRKRLRGDLRWGGQVDRFATDGHDYDCTAGERRSPS